MNWFVSLSVVVLTGFLGLSCGGFVGDACVRWFRISSFEGGSGFFVVFLALLGGIAGLLAGGIATALVSKGPHPSFLVALLWSWEAMLALSGFVVALAWVAADIPPRLGGDELMLAVEVRLAKGASPPAEDEGASLLALHSATGQEARKSETGRMLPEKTRREGNRWIVPGEVFLFTARGKRSLEFRAGGESIPGFLLPLPAKPGESFLENTLVVKYFGLFENGEEADGYFRLIHVRIEPDGNSAVVGWVEAPGEE